MRISPRSLAVTALLALIAVTLQIGQTQAGVGFFRGLKDVMDSFITSTINNVRRLEAADAYLKSSDYPKTSQTKYKEAQDRVCVGSVDISGDVIPSTENQEVLDRVSDMTYTQFTEIVKTQAGGSTVTDYVNALVPIFVIIAFGILILVVLWFPFCFCACCNCCRRGFSCCCCRRPLQPAKHSKKCSWFITGSYSALAIVFFIFSFLGVSYSAQVSSGVKDMQCAIFKFSDSVLYGDSQYVTDNGMSFPGTLGVIRFMRELEAKFAPGSAELTQIQGETDSLLDFSDEVDTFNQELDYAAAATERVYTWSNTDPLTLKPTAGAFYHSYYYGNGLPADLGSFEGAPGVFRTLQVQLGEGLVAALDGVNVQVREVFAPGSAILSSASSALTAAITPMRDVQDAMDDSLGNIGFKTEDQIKAGDAGRNAGFIALQTVAAVVFGLGVLEMLRVFMCSKQEFPNPLGSCCGWCCYLPCAGFFLLIGGLVLAVSAVTGNICTFVRQDLITENKWGEYAETFGINAPQTISIATSCLTVQGDGDILTALDLRKYFTFKTTIDGVFDGLSASMGSSAFDTAALDGAKTYAESIGWLFAADVTNPNIPAEYQLPFEQILTSGVQADDREAVGLTYYGLTTIEGLIAPFFFDSDTGTGTWRSAAQVVTKSAACPEVGVTLTGKSVCVIDGTDANWFDDIDNKAAIERQAAANTGGDAEAAQYIASVWWAHQKALLLNDGFQTVDFDSTQTNDNYVSATRTTVTFEDFSPWIVAVANRVDTASSTLLAKLDGSGQEGGLAADIITTLKTSINVLMLDTVDEFLNKISCTFMLRGMNGVLDGFCTGVVPGLANSASCWVVMGCFGFLCFAFMFHVWKYLKDNIEVNQEVAAAGSAASAANTVHPHPYGSPAPMY